MGNQQNSADALMLGQIGRAGDMVMVLAAIPVAVEIDSAILTIQGGTATGWIGVSSNKYLSGALLDNGTTGLYALVSLLSQDSGVYMMRSCSQPEIERLSGFVLDIAELASRHKQYPEWTITQLVESLGPTSVQPAPTDSAEVGQAMVNDSWLNEVKELIQVARSEQRRMREAEPPHEPVGEETALPAASSPQAVLHESTDLPGELTVSERRRAIDPAKQRITMELRGLNASAEEEVLGEAEHARLAWLRLLYSFAVGGVCLFMAAFVVVAVLRSSAYSAALQQTRQQFAGGAYDAAAHATDGFRGGLPNPAVGLLYSGMAHGMLHQDDDALRQLTASTQSGIRGLGDMALAAQQCRGGNYELACKLCSRALDESSTASSRGTLHPGQMRADGDPFVFLLRAVCEDRLHESDTALSDLRRAQKGQDAQVAYDAKLLMATILMRQNRAEEALAPLTDIIQGGKDARALRMRAQIYQKLERKDLAEADLKLADFIETGL